MKLDDYFWLVHYKKTVCKTFKWLQLISIVVNELYSEIFPSKLNTKNEKNSEFFSEHFLDVLNSYL